MLPWPLFQNPPNGSRNSREVPVGTIVNWSSPAVPPGWLPCNGQTFNATNFPELASTLGSNIIPNIQTDIGAGNAPILYNIPHGGTQQAPANTNTLVMSGTVNSVTVPAGRYMLQATLDASGITANLRVLAILAPAAGVTTIGQFSNAVEGGAIGNSPMITNAGFVPPMFYTVENNNTTVSPRLLVGNPNNSNQTFWAFASRLVRIGGHGQSLRGAIIRAI